MTIFADSLNLIYSVGNMVCNRDRMQQFLPSAYGFLMDTPVVSHHGNRLKTDYIINIMHEFMIRYDSDDEVCSNISSVIMRKKYGNSYMHYMDYLVEIGFLYMVSDYFVGKKARSYRINTGVIYDRTRVDITDKFLLKRQTREWLTTSLVDMFDSPIAQSTREMLIDDLYHVNIDSDGAHEWLDTQFYGGLIDRNKYTRNKHTVDSIGDGHLFYKFDSFGRLHTNFTVIKKHVRNNFIDIDGKQVAEIDIKNSQPFFLGVLMLNEMTVESREMEDVINFIDTVRNGLIYDHFHDRYSEKLPDRNTAKLMIYRVLFGRNNDTIWENDIFSGEFPTVYSFIKEYKKVNGDYKRLSHALQRLESDFIFGKVIEPLKESFPYVRVVTVHDSIIFPSEYRNEVELVFNNAMREFMV